VLRAKGARILTSARVLAARRRPEGLVAETAAGAIRTRVLVNCAGLHSDRVARMCGVEPDVRIVPFRGEYYDVGPTGRHLVRHLIYPVPDPGFPFLGVHFTRRVTGGIEAGPNAVIAFRREGYRRWDASARDMADWMAYPGVWRLGRRMWRVGAQEFARSLSKARFTRDLQKLVPAITEADLAPGGAGVRAQAVDRQGRLVDDFHFAQTPGAVHVLNAPSPAATASLAIGRVVAERVRGVMGG
jgi:L-2-hydroxyglutarate oxidase